MIVACLATLPLHAQTLTVHYRVTYHSQSPDLFAEAGLNEEMRSNLARAYKDVVMTYRLIYENGESDFRVLLPEKKQTIVFMGQDIDPFSGLEEGRNYLYKNHKENLSLNVTTFFGKDHIIRDSLSAGSFLVIQDQVKEILGFECRKAISEDGKTEIWFTPHIPVRNEPFVCGLPGLILEYDDGRQCYSATDIVDTVALHVIRPDDRKAISTGEFEAMVQKITDRMRR